MYHLDKEALKRDKSAFIKLIPAAAAKGQFSSPFRHESNPSCSLSNQQGVWFIKDFGTGESYDIIKAYKTLHSINDEKEVFERLAEEFPQYAQERKSSNVLNKWLEKHCLDSQTIEDLKIICNELEIKFPIHSISNKQRRGYHKRMLNGKHKFMSEKGLKTSVYCYFPITQKNKKNKIIITGGQSDCINAYKSFGNEYDCFALLGEGIQPSELLEHCKNSEAQEIIIFLDNEKAGYIGSKKLARRIKELCQNTNTLIQSKRKWLGSVYKDCKDLSDIAYKHGLDKEAFELLDPYFEDNSFEYLSTLTDDELEDRIKENNENEDISINEVTELLNRKYALTHIGGSTAFINMKTINKKFEDFTLNYLTNRYRPEKAICDYKVMGKDKMVPILKDYFSIWLDHPKRNLYDGGIVFKPQYNHHKTELNLFTGFEVKPKNLVNTAFYWKHAKEYLCNNDQESFEYLFKWLAHLFQYPWILPRTAIVLAGTAEGLGKGSFITPIKEILGSKYYHEFSNSDRLTARFNGDLARKLFIYANEATWGGNKEKEGTLKALITDEFLSIELKNKEPLVLQNYTRLFVTSNNNFVVPVGLDSRRFVFLEPSNTIPSSQYFQEFHSQLKNPDESIKEDVFKSILYDLMTADLSKFVPWRDKPKNNNAIEHKKRSMSPVQEFWFDCLESQENCFVDYKGIDKTDKTWYEIIPRRVLIELYTQYCHSKKRRPESNSIFWDELMRLLPKDIKTHANSVKAYFGERQEPAVKGLNFQKCSEYFRVQVMNETIQGNLLEPLDI